jgi:hypothetical protein
VEAGTTDLIGYLPEHAGSWMKINLQVQLVSVAPKHIWVLLKVLDLKKEIFLENVNKTAEKNNRNTTTKKPFTLWLKGFLVSMHSVFFHINISLPAQ